MKPARFITCIILSFSMLFAYESKAQQQPSVKVSGEVATPLDLKIGDLQQMPQTRVLHKEKDGKEHTYTGVTLAEILQKAGITMGKDPKGKGITQYVLIDAKDGYQVVFALAELDKDFTDRKIILADKVDDKPLPESVGPLQVIVEGEKKAGRCIKQVIAIKVAFAK
jgi:DMSO/TMAO reductase YedYZ molybdopterin-dependent catalytic subunit